MRISDITSLKEHAKAITIQGITVKQGYMSTDQFKNLPNHFVWDEEIRAEKRVEGKSKKGIHLIGEMVADQCVAAIIVYPNGRVERADGNSRAWAMRKEKLKNVSSEMFVTIYYVNDKEESREIFTHIDSDIAVDTKDHTLMYAYKAQNFKPVSKTFSSQATSAISTADRLINGTAGSTKKGNIFKLVEQYLDPIKVIDQLQIDESKPVNHKFKKRAASVAAYIAIAHNYEHGEMAVKEFLNRPMNGWFENLEMEALQANNGIKPCSSKGNANLAVNVYEELELIAKTKFNLTKVN